MHFASSTIINWLFWAMDCTSSDSFCWIFIKKMSLTAKTQFSCWSSLNSGVVYGVGTSSFSFKQTSRNILSEVYQTSSWMNFSYRGSKNSECRCQFSKKKKIATTTFSRGCKYDVFCHFVLVNQFHLYIYCTFRRHRTCQSSVAFFPLDPDVVPAVVDAIHESLKSLSPHHYSSK